jgi:hypothetical protein
MQDGWSQKRRMVVPKRKTGGAKNARQVLPKKRTSAASTKNQGDRRQSGGEQSDEGYMHCNLASTQM